LLDLRLYKNALTGSIPSQIGILPKLELLVLEYNNLTFIPTELAQVSTLERLLLRDNQITTIPSELGLLSRIDTLSVQRNRLRGTIAPEWGQPTTLRRLLLHENFLTGTIPAAFFDHELPMLERLLLYSNNITGSIPSELARVSKLADCWIHSNPLNGTLPSTMGLLTSMTSLSVNDTSIFGTVPEELCRLGESLAFDCSTSFCGCSCACNSSELSWFDEDDTANQTTSPVGTDMQGLISVGWIEDSTLVDEAMYSYNTTGVR
jgi:Leucine rich repeat